MRNFKTVKLFAVVCFFLTTQNSVAQTVEYDVREVTLKAPGIFAGFSLLDFDLGFPTLALGGGADISFYNKQRISIEAGLHFSYYDMKKSSYADVLENQNKISSYSDYRIGFRFHLVDTEGSLPMTAIVSSEQKGNTITTTSFKVKVPSRKIVALHLGYQHYNTLIHVRWPKTVTAQDGTGLSEWEAASTLRVGMIYAGVSIVDIVRATINADIGKWNYKWYRDMYIDALYAPLISVDEVLLNNGNSYVVLHDGENGYKTSPYGVRFGFSNMSQKVYLRYEVGWFPGQAGRGLYTQASMGFSIVKVKK